MIDTSRLRADLAKAGLSAWSDPLADAVRKKVSDVAHGDLPKWQALVGEIPDSLPTSPVLNAPVVSVECAEVDELERSRIRTALAQLAPWRKGPFELCGIYIDAEWRSDRKWQRLEHHVSPLAGRTVLDVGCGNGYYALRMRGAGAKLVIGVDPTVLFVCQFQAVNRLLAASAVHVLPLRLQELPAPAYAFDTTFSMGVLYHQRDPRAHLADLHTTLRPGGELVLETLIWPGDSDEVHVPDDRYARMRNVWHLPSASALTNWLLQSGFDNVRTIDVSATTVDEQRRTDWMPFESLQNALDTDDPSLTIEGLPAPTRAILLANT